MDHTKIILKNNRFFYEGQDLFGKQFRDALRFHAPGLAPVCSDSGWYHIDLSGKALYAERYVRAFGFYFDRAAVFDGKNCFHLNTEGERVYKENYAWCGNYQQNLCTVCSFDNQYFHIRKNGQPAYNERYAYAGDFREGTAAVRLHSGKYKHILPDGSDLNGKLFNDLGVFHKKIAAAKDKVGWFHINQKGQALYGERYAALEPFYNGFALAEDFDGQKIVINETGQVVRRV